MDRTQLFDTLSNLSPAAFQRLLYAVNPPGGLVPGDTAPQMNRGKALLDWAEGPTGPGLEKIQNCLDRLKSDSLPPAFDFPRYLRFVCQDPRYQQVRDLYTQSEVLIPLEAETVESQTSSDVDIQTDEAKQPKVERFPILEGLQKYALGEQRQHLLLAGRPGSGKSTTLKRLLLEMADAALKRPEMIPVYVQLKGDHPITELIRAEFRRAKMRVSAEQLEDWLLEDRLLLLLDGVNEIPSDQQRRNLETFREDNPTTAMIFTTRDLAVGGDLGIQKRLKMRPLSEAQMREFVNKYLTKRGLPNQADTLLRQLKDRLREVAETPLLLKMLCDVFDSETRQIPQSKGELFRLFDAKYDQFKGLVAVSEDFRRFKPELLRHLAFCMLQGDPANPPAAWLTLDRNRAESLLEHYLSGRVDAPGQWAKEWLEDLLEHHLLQVAANPRELEFHHQLFQEYYAAEALLILLPELLRDEAKFKRDYLNYLKWTESIALMLSLVDDEAQALRVVKLALDDVDLMLGARLAGEVKAAFQPKTIGWIDNREIPINLKISCWAASHSEAAIPGLLEALKDLDVDVRRNAATILSKVSSEAAIPGLLDALKDPSHYVRLNAATALWKVGSEAAIPGLLQALQDQNISVRISAAQALQGLGGKAIIPGLLQALQDQNIDVRSHAAKGLGNLGSEAAIPGLLQALQDQEWKVRESAAEGLMTLGSEAAIPGLLKTLEHTDRHVRGRAAEVLVDLGSEEAIPGLLKTIEHQNSAVRIVAAKVLWGLGSEAAVPGLVKVLGDKDPKTRARAATALGQLGSKAAIPDLIKALEDQDFSVCWEVTYVLARLGSEAATLGLLKVLEHPNFHVATSGNLRRLGSKTARDGLRLPGLLIELVNSLSLADLSIDHDATILGLLKVLEHPDQHVRNSATFALAKLGDETALSSLLQAMGNQNSYIRRGASFALGYLGSEAAFDSLLKALKDPDSNVRQSAAKALEKLGNEAALDGLLKALKDPDSNVRQSAVKALEKLGNEAALNGLLIALDDGDHEVCVCAANMLGKLGSEAAIPSLLQATRNQNSYIRRSAVEALGNLGSEAAIPGLTKALQDPDRHVRQSAAWAMRNLGSAAIPRLLKVLESRNYHHRWCATRALGNLKSEAAIPGLLQALQDPVWNVCSSAVDGLVKLGSEAAIQGLLTALEHSDSYVRRGAAKALGDTGSDVAIPGLLKALGNPDSCVRRIAFDGLAKLGNEAAIQGLLTALGHSDSYVRRRAAKALGDTGSDVAIPGLLKALGDPDSCVRSSAAEALGGTGSEAAVTGLLKALDDSNSDVRSSATNGLAKIGSVATIIVLWKLHRRQPKSYLKYAISTIQKRYQFYNYEIFQGITPEGKTICLYCSYAPADETLQAQLANHLTLLKRQGIITSWSSHQILPGDDRTQTIHQQLNTADIILLLISAYSLADDTCYHLEIQRAMERHQSGEARVIPILLRPVDWQGAPFSQLDMLPKNHQPVTTWPNQDQAFQEIATGIRETALELRRNTSAAG